MRNQQMDSLPELQPATTVKHSYEKPAITFETELEVRAGTPLGLPDPDDLLDLGQ
jgi:hypothetical protein